MAGAARLRDVVPSATLRVYQPIDAFERDEQLHWERYLVEGSRGPTVRSRYADRPGAGALGMMSPADGEHAEVRVVDGRTYVSPWRVRLRVLTAIASFPTSPDLELADDYVTRKDRRRAQRQLVRFRRRDPRVQPFAHVAAWHVPIRWFVLFRDDDRALEEDRFGRVRLRYTTTIRRAMRRAEQAIPVLRRSELGPISELILDLHQWLATFDPGSLVELDYGSLCDVLSWDELDDDRSARDLREALEALEAGEYPRSADIYQGVLSRWAEVRSREVMN
jgi:hypothetical protein